MKIGKKASATLMMLLIAVAIGYAFYMFTKDKPSPTEQIKREIFCISLYDPVCSTDGNTYQNECELNKAKTSLGSKETLAYKGKCKSPSELPEGYKTVDYGYVMNFYLETKATEASVETNICPEDFALTNCGGAVTHAVLCSDELCFFTYINQGSISTSRGDYLKVSWLLGSVKFVERYLIV